MTLLKNLYKAIEMNHSILWRSGRNLLGDLFVAILDFCHLTLESVTFNPKSVIYTPVNAL